MLVAPSHICTGCGSDLTARRAPPDPVYGLPVVVCPACQRPSVRTRASVERGFRRVRAAARSWLALLGQGVLLALVLTAVIAPYQRIEDLILRNWRMGWVESARAIASGTLADETGDADAMALLGVPSGVFIVGAVALGAWIRFGLGHIRLPVAHGVWVVVAFLSLTVPPLVLLAQAEFIPHHRQIHGLTADERAGRLAASCLSALIAVAGTPLGRALDQAWRHQRSRLFAARRKQLRELRRPPA